MFVLAFVAIPNTHVEGEQKQRRTIRETLDHFDLPGGACGVIALVLFNFAYNQSVVTTWHKPYVYVCLILSFLFLTAFFYIELRLAHYPILTVAVLTSDIAFVFGCTAAGWSTFVIWVSTDIGLKIMADAPRQTCFMVTEVLSGFL